MNALYIFTFSEHWKVNDLKTPSKLRQKGQLTWSHLWAFRIPNTSDKRSTYQPLLVSTTWRLQGVDLLMELSVPKVAFSVLKNKEANKQKHSIKLSVPCEHDLQSLGKIGVLHCSCSRTACSAKVCVSAFLYLHITSIHLYLTAVANRECGGPFGVLRVRRKLLELKYQHNSLFIFLTGKFSSLAKLVVLMLHHNHKFHGFVSLSVSTGLGI